MTDPGVNRKLGRVNRFEVIDHRKKDMDERGYARAFQALGAKIELSFQDGGQTLKVFVSDADPGREEAQ
jgi:hypothetical protein